MQEYYSMNDPNDPKPVKPESHWISVLISVLVVALVLDALLWGLKKLLYTPDPPLYGCTIQEWVQTNGQPERVLVCPPGVHVDRIYNDVNPPLTVS